MVAAQYSCKVARLETKDGCPLGPGASLNRTFSMKPLAQFCTHERGLALDAALSKVSEKVMHFHWGVKGEVPRDRNLQSNLKLASLEHSIAFH